MISKSIGYNQALHYRNVVSRYVSTDITLLDDKINECIEDVLASGYTLADNFFYCINSDLTKTDDMLVQIFMPVNEDYKGQLPEEYMYNSYFQVFGMVGYRSVDSEASMTQTLTDLVSVLIESDTDPLSPIFFVPKVVNETVYFDLLVKIK